MESQNSLLPILSVSDFLASVNQTLEYAYPSIEIEGEVMSFKVNQNKFIFFDLKDSGGSVGCFMTVWQMRMPIEDGMKVIVRATAKVTQWGKFSLTVQSVRPSGEGSLKKSYDLLKAKLAGEGLFAVERKRVLPEIPQHIAVISSTQAAGYADFIKIINDRWGGMRVDVAHTQVQGVDAPDQIIRAIKYFNEQAELPEVLVIIRGGGSADDLSSFNDEQLVREIAASRIPTLVGVGHEVDETLADFAADVRAATPSNAAQLIVPDKREVIAGVRHTVSNIVRALTNNLDTMAREVVVTLEQMVQAMAHKHERVQEQLVAALAVLQAYNPQSVLKRGYAIVRGEPRVGNVITINTYTSEIMAEVKNVKASAN